MALTGSHGTLRKIRYFTDTKGLRHLKSCVVEIPSADDVSMPHLPKQCFPILPDITDLKFEHGSLHHRCTIKRTQVSIEPGFAMTVHKAQGQTMERVIVDLAGCSRTEPPYVNVSRATSLQSLMVLHKFDFKQITKHHSEDLRKEFACLLVLKWKTVMIHGDSSDCVEVKQVLTVLEETGLKRGTKQKEAMSCEHGSTLDKKHWGQGGNYPMGTW